MNIFMWRLLHSLLMQMVTEACIFPYQFNKSNVTAATLSIHLNVLTLFVDITKCQRTYLWLSVTTTVLSGYYVDQVSFVDMKRTINFRKVLSRPMTFGCFYFF